MVTEASDITIAVAVDDGRAEAREVSTEQEQDHSKTAARLCCILHLLVYWC